MGISRRDKYITLILSCLLVASSVLAALIVLGFESDVWWHLKFGQELLAGRQIDGIDTWSWLRTDSGDPLPWIQHEWLFAILLALVNKLPFGLYILGPLSHVLVVIYFLPKVLNRVSTFNQTLFTTLYVIFGAMLTYNPAPRPHALGILCLLAYLHFTWRFGQTYDFKYLSPLPVITVFWTNLWGGTVLLSVCILGTVLVQMFLQRAKQLLPTLGVLLGILALNFATPVGWKSVVYRFFNSADQSLITEWRHSMYFGKVSIWMLTLVVVLTLWHKQLLVFEWLLAIGSFSLTAFYERFAFFPFFVSVFLMIKYLGSPTALGSVTSALRVLWANLILVTGLFVLVMVICGTGIYSPSILRPVSDELIELVHENNPQRLYTHQDSGILIFQDIPVFVDSRADPFTKYYTLALEVMCGYKPFSQLDDMLDFDYALIPISSHSLDQFSEYPVIGQDECWIFYKLN